MPVAQRHHPPRLQEIKYGEDNKREGGWGWGGVGMMEAGQDSSIYTFTVICSLAFI